MIGLLAKVLGWVTGLNPLMRAIMVVSAAILAVFVWIKSLWADLFARLDQMAAVAMSDSLDFSALGLLNYCFPLDLLLSYVVAYGGIRLTLVGVRIIKSFIPTIA